MTIKINKNTTVLSNGHKTLVLIKDNEPDVFDPRYEENLCHLYCWHTRYSLGDEDNHFKHADDFFVWLLETYAKKEDCRAYLEKRNCDPNDLYGYEWSFKEVESLVKEQVCMECVSLYDHSGLYMSLGYQYGWDVGAVGIIWCSKERVIKNGFDESEWENVVHKQMEYEIRVYNSYLCGDAYAIKHYKGYEEVDSVYGFLSGSFKNISDILYEGLELFSFDTSENLEQYDEDIDEFEIENFIMENYPLIYKQNKYEEINTRISNLVEKRDALAKELGIIKGV